MPLARFRLKASQHIAADPAVEQTFRPDGTPIKRPSRIYYPGDAVEDDFDLAARFGRDKFELLSGSPKPATPLNAPPPPRGGLRPPAATTATGAVIPGQPVTITLADGSTVTGTINAPVAAAKPVTATIPARDPLPELPARSHFERMNKAELEEYAADNEIDLGDGGSKTDMIDTIMTGLGNTPDE